VIRNNLSTRPFYNVAAVRVWLAIGVLVALLITGFNVMEVLRYSNSNTELAMRASADEARAADIRTEAQKLRASVNVAEVNAVSVDARLANDLIDRRTFSWTELFNRFERTLPDDVRITAVRPRVDRQRGIVLVVDVVARSVDDVNRFMENLDSTGAFADLRSTQEKTNESDQIESALEMVYQPPRGAPAATPAPTSGRDVPAEPAGSGAPGAAR
jgi:Tfp pilus assembly protein PilN